MRKAGVGLVIVAAASVAFVAGYGAIARAGDDKGGGVAEERLPGSRVSLQEAVRLSGSIVVVRGVDMGRPSSRVSSGKRFYVHVKLNVVKSLKGDAPQEIFPVRVTLITLPKA